jgi:hypothetical protein
MKKRTTFFCLALLFFTQSLWAQTYVFNGTGNWNDPSKWTPSYPGTFMSSGQTVDIQGYCNLNAYVVFYGGSLIISSGGTLSVNADMGLEVNATSFEISSFLILGNFINNGYFSSDIGSPDFQNLGTYTENGLYSGVFAGTWSNDGTIIVPAGKTLLMGSFEPSNNGLIKGNGSLNGPISNNAAGSIAPGENSPGCLTFNDDLVNSGDLLIELADGSACDDYDFIMVNSVAIINGNIIISFPSGAPSTTTFTILHAGVVLGGSPSLIFPSGYSGSASISGGDLIITLNAPLPVELTGFEARKAQNNVELNWNTESEAGNKGFEIQRSANSDNWETIGFVQGNGDTQVKQAYGFFDRQPYSGANYYRLKQIDFDGKYTLFNIVSVHMPEQGASVCFFPNPAADHASCSIRTDYEGAVNMRLYNAIGRVVLEKQISADGPAREDLELSDLPAGLYVTEVIVGTKRYVGQLVVQH